jgi:hypothetical protein
MPVVVGVDIVLCCDVKAPSFKAMLSTFLLEHVDVHFLRDIEIIVKLLLSFAGHLK